MISAFGVEYRSISKAEVKLGDKEKAGIVGAATIGGAYAGHEAVLRPDYWYNENVHKPWFTYQKDQALKNEKTGKKARTAAAERAAAAEKDSAESYPKRKEAAEGKYKKLTTTTKYPIFHDTEMDPKNPKKRLVIGEGERTPTHENIREAAAMKMPVEGEVDAEKHPTYKEDKALSERGKYQHKTRMTPKQARAFQNNENVPGKPNYVSRPPTKKLQQKYGYDDKLPPMDPKNVKAIGSPHKGGSNWHKSKDFFRNFPKDMPGANYRRAGGWYSKGKTGHAVSIAMTGLGAYAAYKGSSKLVNRNQKVSKGVKIKGMKLKQLVDTPEKLLPKKMQPHYVDDNSHLIEPKLMKDPGFFVPAVSYPVVGTAGYLAMRHGQKKRKKVAQ